mgnify:CR=1 FL=1
MFNSQQYQLSSNPTGSRNPTNLALQTSELTTSVSRKSQNNNPRATSTLNMIEFLKIDTPAFNRQNYFSKSTKTTPKKERHFVSRPVIKTNNNLEIFNFNILATQNEAELLNLKHSLLHKNLSTNRGGKKLRHLTLPNEMRAMSSNLSKFPEIDSQISNEPPESVAEKRTELICFESTRMTRKNERNKSRQFFDMMMHSNLEGWNIQDSLEDEVEYYP